MVEHLPYTTEHHRDTRYFPPCQMAVEAYRRERKGRWGQTLPLSAHQSRLRFITETHGSPTNRRQHIDSYNPSVSFIHHGKEFVASRIEPAGKAGEHDSVVAFFFRRGEEWVPLLTPTFRMQDPNITWINGQMMLSGVELQPGENPGDVEYRMAFYVVNLENGSTRLAEGPWGMKGIRLVKLSDGRIGIYTRPQGAKGGLGQIGFTIAESLQDFQHHALDLIDNAPLLDYRFPPGEWGGVNQAMLLPDGHILAIGHRAYRDTEGSRHYYPWAFVHDPVTGEVIDLGILAERADFPPGPAKAPDLIDVLYTAGIVRRFGKWFLIVGLSDSQAGMIEVNIAEAFKSFDRELSEKPHRG